MDTVNTSVDANSTQMREEEKISRNKQKIYTHRGQIKAIEEKTSLSGSKYYVLYIDNKIISSFDVDLSDFLPFDFVEVEYKQKGVYLNLVSIKKIENDQLQKTENHSHQSEVKYLSASIKFASSIPERISFRDGLPHSITILGDEEAEITDLNGNKKTGIRYFVEEDGKKKEFFTTSIQLIKEMSKLRVGDVVKIQLTHKNISGRVRSYYEISKISK